VIFSDSKSSLESLQNLNSALRPNLLTEILEILTEISQKIIFVWIPAHVNLSGNEMADQLAKSALQHKLIDLNIKFESRELYGMVDKYILNKWQLEWSNSKTSNVYITFENKVNKNIKHVESSRQNQTLITRLRLGACGLNSHLFKIGCHLTGLCMDCNVPETVEHYIINCPKSEIAKFLKLKCLELKLPFDLQHCLSDHNLTKLIFEIIPDHVCKT